MENIIFEYASGPSYGRNLTMQSVTVKTDGQIISRKYSSYDNTILAELPIACIPELATQIGQIIHEREADISQVPNLLHNDIRDGSVERFQFGQKIIKGFNVTISYQYRHDGSCRMKAAKPGTNEFYEDIVMSIFDRIADAARKHDITID